MSYKEPPNSNGLVGLVFLLLISFAMVLAMCGSVPEEADVHFTCETGQGNIFNATAIISVSPDAYVDLENGDVVGVFDSAGDCVGQGLFTFQDNFAITIWADNPATPEKDGFISGSALALKIYGERLVNVAATSPLLAYTDSVYVIEGVSFQDGGVIEILEQQIAGLSAANTQLQQNLDIAIASLDSLNNDLQVVTQERNILANQTVVLNAEVATANGKLLDIQAVLDRNE